MDKMLVDSLGDVVITNDGVTILKEIDIEHPAAKMLVEVAKTQDEEAGDGTTTAVVLAGELLKRAEDLIEQNIHPTVIAAGYRQAADKAREVLEKVAMKISVKDLDTLKKVAMTAMSSKSASGHKELLADVSVKAVTTVAEQRADGRDRPEERCERALLPEGHRRPRAALPREAGHLRRAARQEVRHGKAREGHGRENRHEARRAHEGRPRLRQARLREEDRR